MSEESATEITDAPCPRKAGLLQKTLPLLIAAACFAYLYGKLSAAAGQQGLTLFAYLGGVFAHVEWGSWLLLMVPYSFFFFLIDTGVVWRVVGDFNTRVRYRDMLPIRGSSYILSILNEQVGKGAMGLYLNRRYGVPGWEVGSSMLFIMFCEFYYLLAWATLGWWIGGDALPAIFGWIPWIAAVAGLFFGAWLFVFRGSMSRPPAFRDRPVFKAFREARLRNYLTVVAMRSPALLAAVVIYTLALRLFGVEASFIQMLGYLPVIFFGAATPGPMRTGAITLWVALFPEKQAGEMAAFGLVQHNFFIFFNAAIGLIFLRRANRELFD